MKKEEFLSLYKNGHTDFSNQDLSDMSFEFDSNTLTGLNFNNANLQQVSFHSAIIEDCTFDGALLEDAGFRFAKINKSSFKEANLRTTSMYDALITQTDFTNADLTNAITSSARFESCKLYNAKVDGISFRTTTFIETAIEDANLTEVKEDILNYCENARSTYGDLCIPYLVKAIEVGHVDGGDYGDGEGTAACLVGTIANAFCINPHILNQDADSLRESWFLAIDEFDTPKTNIFSRLSHQWLTERYGEILANPEYADIAL